MVCNGHAELCSRSYGNVTFAGAHDSFAFSANPLDRTSDIHTRGYRPNGEHYSVARDQIVDITSQLNLGVRLLQAQAHE